MFVESAAIQINSLSQSQKHLKINRNLTLNGLKKFENGKFENHASQKQLFTGAL